jgi:DNA repair protein RadC
LRWPRLFAPPPSPPSTPVAAPAPAPARPVRNGFEEAVEAIGRYPAFRSPAEARATATRAEEPRPPRGAPPFPSTGPEKHRHRMREQPKGDTKPLAKHLINRFGSFAAVLAAPQQELFECRGLGEHSVAALKLVHASALRLARAEVIDRPVLNNWDRLIDYLTAAMARERIEQFRVLFLDSRNRLLADEAQGRGTVNHTPVYPREIMRRALELHATALILCTTTRAATPLLRPPTSR